METPEDEVQIRFGVGRGIMIEETNISKQAEDKIELEFYGERGMWIFNYYETLCYLSAFLGVFECEEVYHDYRHSVPQDPVIMSHRRCVDLRF